MILVQTGGREVLVQIFFFREQLTRSFEMDISKEFINSQHEKMLCHDAAFRGVFLQSRVPYSKINVKATETDTGIQEVKTKINQPKFPQKTPTLQKERKNNKLF